MMLFQSKSARSAYLVMRSYSRIAKRFDKITVELKELNGWMKILPGLFADETADFPDPEDWVKSLIAYGQSSDDIASAMFENAELMKEVAKALEFYQKFKDEL